MRLALLEKLEKLFPKSLISEFFKMFGPEATQKLLTVFGGTTIKVPSTEDLENANRDLYIYEQLMPVRGDAAKSKEIGARLERELDLSRRKIRAIFRRQRRLHKEAELLKKHDEAVGKHKRRKFRRIRHQRRSRI